jgi:hypothetical protein
MSYKINNEDEIDLYELGQELEIEDAMPEVPSAPIFPNVPTNPVIVDYFPRVPPSRLSDKMAIYEGLRTQREKILIELCNHLIKNCNASIVNKPEKIKYNKLYSSYIDINGKYTTVVNQINELNKTGGNEMNRNEMNRNEMNRNKKHNRTNNKRNKHNRRTKSKRTK